MAYPERQPFYNAYKEMVDKIIQEKHLKEYAESEIKALNQSLFSALEEIGKSHVIMKWPKEGF